jgi:hypothetical protein
MVMRNARIGLVGLFLTLIAAFAGAAEAYVFRFHSQGASGGVLRIEWNDDLILHNTTGQDQVVRLLEMTGGAGDRTPQIPVPAGRTVTLNLLNRPGIWEPEALSLWVVHLEVPDGVLVRSRADAFSCLCLGGQPQSGVPDFGSFAMPVFAALVPAGERQVHMGADLGGETSRVNVGFFNGGTTASNVSIDLYSACGDQLVERQTLAVGPGSVRQISLAASTLPECSDPSTAPWLRYVTVVADQPSLSYVVNRQSDLSSLPRIPYGSAAGP